MIQVGDGLLILEKEEAISQLQGGVTVKALAHQKCQLVSILWQWMGQ